MPASYIERLVWKYFKENVFGGFRGFVDRNTVALTFLVSVLLAYEYAFKVRLQITILIAVSMITLGLILWRKPIQVKVSATLAIILGGIWLSLLYFGFDIDLGIVDPKLMLVATLLAWYLFNSSLFIVQMTDFFASTAGIIILYGSDKDRVFLSPLILLSAVALVGIAAWRLLATPYEFALSIAPTIIALVFTYLVFRGKGRILRSAFGMFVFVAISSTIGFVMGFGATGNATMWIIITVFSLLFAIQKHTRTLVKEKRVGMKFGFVTFLGLILLILHLLITPEYTAAISIREIWILSILAVIFAPIVATAYLYAARKVAYYVRRNRFTWKTILQEVAVALGTMAVREIANIAMREVVSRIFGGKKK